MTRTPTSMRPGLRPQRNKTRLTGKSETYRASERQSHRDWFALNRSFRVSSWLLPQNNRRPSNFNQLSSILRSYIKLIQIQKGVPVSINANSACSFYSPVRDAGGNSHDGAANRKATALATTSANR